MSPAVQSLAEQYHFADFTEAHYRTLLRQAREHYVFRTFETAVAPERFVIWRHDADYSMHRAVALARIEAEEGVQSTYFLLPHSEMYNLLEREITQLARAIAQCGHAIGLHLDTAYYGVSTESELDDLVAWEASLLERIVDRPVSAVAFHNPTAFELGCQQAQYGGRWNAYAARFQGEVGYVSDSNGYWRNRRLADVLTAATDHSLQVLTHPEWWTDTPLSPAERIERCIAGRAAANRSFYRNLLHRSGRSNVGA